MILAIQKERYYKQKKTGFRRTGLTKGQRNLLNVIIVMKRAVEILVCIATGGILVGIWIKSMPLVRFIGFFGMLAIILSALVTVYLVYRLKKQLGYNIYYFKDANRGR
jgi:predicted Co/Zn/Cd cation transporter (cation efflux family)